MEDRFWVSGFGFRVSGVKSKVSLATRNSQLATPKALLSLNPGGDLVILGLLVTMVAPKIMGRTDEAKRTKAAADLRAIQQAPQSLQAR